MPTIRKGQPLLNPPPLSAYDRVLADNPWLVRYTQLVQESMAIVRRYYAATTAVQAARILAQIAAKDAEIRALGQAQGLRPYIPPRPVRGEPAMTLSQPAKKVMPEVAPPSLFDSATPPATAASDHAIYVDEIVRWDIKPASGAERYFGNGKPSCHMSTPDHSPEGLAALHRFAEKLGMRRSWFQNDKVMPHYDLTPSKRALALKAGAVGVTGQDIIRLCARYDLRQELQDGDAPEPARPVFGQKGQVA
jgi:hypothetical protein